MGIHMEPVNKKYMKMKYENENEICNMKYVDVPDDLRCIGLDARSGSNAT